MAPALDIPHGALEVQGDERAADGRRLRLHLTLAPQVLDGQVLLSADGPLADVLVNGSRLASEGASANSLHLNFNGRFADGLLLQLTAPASALSVTLVERTPGLPTVPGLVIRPRPATMIPALYNSVADSTLVRQSWRLAP
jgi:hypothetical protein